MEGDTAVIGGGWTGEEIEEEGGEERPGGVAFPNPGGRETLFTICSCSFSLSFSASFSLGLGGLGEVGD